jgi:PAS domain S-box-containing protein
MPSESPAELDRERAALKAKIAAAEGILAERDAALAALREREGLFRTIVENQDRVFWIITSDQRRMIYLSPATEHILGRARARIYADPRSWIEAIHPEDRARVLAAVASRLSGQAPDPRHVIFRARRPDGSVRWLRSSGIVIPAPDRDGDWYVGTAEDVTELKLAADAESEREALLRLMTEQIPAVLWTTGRGLEIRSAGGRGLIDLGVNADQLRGMGLNEYFDRDDAAFPAIAGHRRALAGETVTFELSWAGRDYENHLEPLRDATGEIIGVHGMALDVTDRKRAEAAARAAHGSLRQAHAELNTAHAELRQLFDHLEQRVAERTAALDEANARLKREVAERARAEESLQRSVDLYRLLAENSTDGIARHDVNGRYQYVSPAYRSILGYEPAELIGRASYTLVHPDDVPIVARAHQEVLTGSGRATVSFRLAHRDGGHRWVEVSARRVSTSGEDEIVTVMRDVSARKATEERLRKMQEDLVHVARLSTLGEMASGLAHEFERPLATVLARLETGRALLAAECAVPPALDVALKEAVAEATRAERIVQGWRVLGRRGTTDRRAEDMNRLVTAVVELTAAEARRKRVRMEVDLAPDLPPVVADAMLLQQVIMNLLRNALEAIGEENAGERRVTVRTRAASAGEVEVAVSDTGHGLEAVERERLFEPFYTTKEWGMGLGLPICHSIVAGHGGRLWADAESGAHGDETTFHFVLPAIGARDKA